MAKVYFNEAQLIHVSQRFSQLSTLARISSGSKTNDQIIRSSLRDLEKLIQFAYENSSRKLFKAPRRTSKSLNEQKTFLAEISSFKPLF